MDIESSWTIESSWADWNAMERKAYTSQIKQTRRAWEMEDKAAHRVKQIMKENNRAWLKDEKKVEHLMRASSDWALHDMISRKDQRIRDRKAYTDNIVERKKFIAKMEQERLADKEHEKRMKEQEMSERGERVRKEHKEMMEARAKLLDKKCKGGAKGKKGK